MTRSRKVAARVRSLPELPDGCLPLEEEGIQDWAYNPNSPSLQAMYEGCLSLDDEIKARAIKARGYRAGERKPARIKKEKQAWCPRCKRIAPIPCVECAARAFRVARGKSPC